MPSLLKPPTEHHEPNVHWPPTLLDLEPEQLWCLPHGQELPCGKCEAPSRATIRKESR